MSDNNRSAQSWNPPPRPERADAFCEDKNVQSANECTGLVQKPPQDVEEAYALGRLYAIHTLKPQDNAGEARPES